jgi:[NiFe] hydrogenase assembly HybE family chaperone
MLPDPSQRLESAFRAIHENRMRDLAFVNQALRVEAIGFAPWKHYWLGVMLTPWSMNLVLAPRDPAAFRALPQGEKRRCRFPAGDFDFIAAADERIGDYFVCSLFSPVLEFADHESARETARLALVALLDPTLDPSRAAPISRRDLVHGRFEGSPR